MTPLGEYHSNVVKQNLKSLHTCLDAQGKRIRSLGEITETQEKRQKSMEDKVQSLQMQMQTMISERKNHTILDGTPEDNKSERIAAEIDEFVEFAKLEELGELINVDELEELRELLDVAELEVSLPYLRSPAELIDCPAELEELINDLFPTITDLFRFTSDHEAETKRYYDKKLSAA